MYIFNAINYRNAQTSERFFINNSTERKMAALTALVPVALCLFCILTISLTDVPFKKIGWVLIAMGVNIGNFTEYLVRLENNS